MAKFLQKQLVACSFKRLLRKKSCIIRKEVPVIDSLFSKIVDLSLRFYKKGVFYKCCRTFENNLLLTCKNYFLSPVNCCFTTFKHAPIQLLVILTHYRPKVAVKQKYLICRLIIDFFKAEILAFTDLRDQPRTYHIQFR